MLLTRLWILLLAGTATFAVASVLVAGNIVDRERDTALNEMLARDRSIAEALLGSDARLRIDNIAAFAMNEEVKQVLLRAGAQHDPDRLKPLNSRLLTQLETLNTKLGEMNADVLFALDQHGTIVAQLGVNKAQFGSSLETFPLVQAALSGWLRDDVWVYSGAVYRMAARPVIHNGNYIGAIIHGKQVNEELAQRLSKKLGGASIAFFLGKKIIAAYQPVDVSHAPTEAQLQTVLSTALGDPKLRQGSSSAYIPLDDTGRAVFSWMTGPPKSLEVGYAIGRPRQNLGSASTVLSQASSKDTEALPYIWLLGLFLMLAALGMLFIWLERDRAMRRFEQAVDAFAKKQTERLSPIEFSGAFRRIIEAFNQGMEHVVEKKRGPKRKENLDEILGPSLESPSGIGFFDFPKEELTAPVVSTPNSHRLPAAQPIHIAPVAPVAQAPSATKPKAPPPPPPPPPGRLKAPTMDSQTTAEHLSKEPRRSSQSEAPTEAKSAEEVARLSLAGTQFSRMDDDFAVISEVSSSIGMERRSNPSSRAPHAVIKGPSPKDKSSSESQGTDYQSLYREFITIKKKCGEPTAGFTYEKFLAAVNKNREQIIKRHNAKDVRFSVYEKNGKAALKAKPLR